MSELSDLFARDPLKLTKEDRAQIIAHMRANRASFMAGQRTTSVDKASKAAKTPTEKVAKGSINLGDLGL